MSKKVPSRPEPKDWNQAIAVLEEWRSQTLKITEALEMRFNSFERKFDDFRDEMRAEFKTFKHALMDVGSDVKMLKEDNAKFLSRLAAVEHKVGIA